MAETLKFGNGTWATKKGSTLAYNDEDNNFKPLPFSFTRDSLATRVNKEGLIEVVSNDVPRIDYTDSTEGALLLEPSGSNLVTYSQDFSNAAWNTGSTRSVNFIPTSTIDPQGKTNAYRITSTASDNQVAFLGSIISGQSYASSIYVRRVSGSGNVILRNVNNGENNFQVSVNDGWKRIETTVTSTSTNGRLYINLQTVGDVIEIWGAQLEQGNYATSYIPTNGSTVQRAAETANGSGNSEVFNDSEGVLIAEISAFSETGSAGLISLSDGTISNRITIELDGNIVKGRLTPSIGILNSSTNITLSTKVALKYKEDDFALWVNGFEAAAINLGNTFSDGTLTELAFDRGDGVENFYGNTKQIGYYDTVLTDAELEILTSYRSLNEMVTELNLNAL